MKLLANVHASAVAVRNSYLSTQSRMHKYKQELGYLFTFTLYLQRLISFFLKEIKKVYYCNQACALVMHLFFLLIEADQGQNPNEIRAISILFLFSLSRFFCLASSLGLLCSTHMYVLILFNHDKSRFLTRTLLYRLYCLVFPSNRRFSA